jgi:hypothetical protein
VSKRAPDQTIALRLELQQYERKALANAQTARAVKDFAEAIDKLTSFENLYIVVTLIELATGKEILPGTPNDVYYIIDAIKNFDVSDLLGKGLGEVGDIFNILKDFLNPLSPGFEGDESFL